MIHEHPTPPAGPNTDVAAGLRELATFLEDHPELPGARFAFVSLRANLDRQPARQTLELIARALGEQATERRTLSGVEIAGEFGPCRLIASAATHELARNAPPIPYEPIIPAVAALRVAS